ncbi:MAG TPA: PEP-CTERM sorting domain-containing protein [Steroidobacteraceae bacterium]|nr:PEP-CTERM sorting domain-containing protein [Steroidobacteraceae bacterium]
MKPLPTLLSAAFLAATPALQAQEVQMTFDGAAACGPTRGCAPWWVSFDVDTASGPQVQGLINHGGVTYVSAFGANVEVTNFAEFLGGNDLHGPVSASVRATSGSIAFNNLPLQLDPAFQVNVLNFAWMSEPHPSPTEAQFNASPYPLQDYLLGFNGQSVTSDTAALLPGLGIINETTQIGLEPVRITVTHVPEPGVLVMLLTGLLGVAGMRRIPTRVLPRS